MKQPTVTINGTVYDIRTGKPLHVARDEQFAARHGAHTVHTQLQKSKTLNRRYVKKQSADKITKRTISPTAEEAKHTVSTAATRHKVNHAISVHRSPSTANVRRSSRIAHHVGTASAQPIAVHHATKDIQHITHPVVQRTEERRTTQQAARVIKPSHVIKCEAIERATATMHSKEVRHSSGHRKSRSKVGRLISVASASLAVLLLGAYLTYLNMPALSTRVAATQAGIDASYPSYQPMGYSLDGPVAYKQGSVSMKFAANGGPESYTLGQTKSGWDSSAVLEYYVQPKVGRSYTTTSANGLTIYTYGSSAVWVNNGILYTIDGSAVLSNNQIQRIATSL